MTVPKTMQAAVLEGHGGPEMLTVQDAWPVPTPGAGEVLIAVGAAGINNTDLWTREGAYGDPADPTKRVGWRGVAIEVPRIQGLDIVGRIVGVGQDVAQARIGERVLVDPVLPDPDGGGLPEARLIGSERDGGFAGFVAVPAGNAVAIDSPLSDAELASFPCAHLTGEHMLNRARVAPGERVMVTGASGGVGSALVQLIRARGARPIAVVGRGKEAQAEALGAERVIVREDGVRAQTEAAIGVRAVDVVADLVGGAMFEDLLGVLRPEGRYVTAGAIAGPRVTLDLRTLYLHHLETIGSSIWTHDEFLDLVAHIEAGRLQPLLAKTYPLAQIQEAQAAFAEKRFFGKLVLVPQAGSG